MDEETGLAGGLVPHDGTLVISVSRATSTPAAAPDGRTTTLRSARPSLVRTAESSTTALAQETGLAELRRRNPASATSNSLTRPQRQKSATGVARHRPGERETIGSVATRALTEDSVEMEFLTDDPVAQAVTYQRVTFDARAPRCGRYVCATAGRVNWT